MSHCTWSYCYLFQGQFPLPAPPPAPSLSTPATVDALEKETVRLGLGIIQIKAAENKCRSPGGDESLSLCRVNWHLSLLLRWLVRKKEKKMERFTPVVFLTALQQWSSNYSPATMTGNRRLVSFGFLCMLGGKKRGKTCTVLVFVGVGFIRLVLWG